VILDDSSSLCDMIDVIDMGDFMTKEKKRHGKEKKRLAGEFFLPDELLEARVGR